MEVTITVNGTTHRREVRPRTLLVDFLRDELGLTGTNVGCDTTQCGACTILMDGRAVKCCTLLAVQADGGEITTIEGLTGPAGGGGGADLHPMQRAFTEEHGLQCGFCTPGMILSAVELVEAADGELTDDEIRRGLDGNLCRCTGYENIVDAVRRAGVEMKG